MSVPIPEKFYGLFSRPILYAFTTINPDGSPHSVPVWCDYDGARVWVNLMAATCLLRSTIHDFTRGSVEPKPETLETLSRGLRFLDPENPDTTAGWRERLTPETLANVLGVDVRTASDLFHGKRRWHEEERARLAVYMRSEREVSVLTGGEPKRTHVLMHQAGMASSARSGSGAVPRLRSRRPPNPPSPRA